MRRFTELVHIHVMRIITTAAVSFALLCSAPAYADEVHDALEAYASYQNDVSALLDSEIAGAQDVDAALARLQRHDTERVARGWIAYGALTAAQSPDFATMIQRSARGRDRASVIGQLRGTVSYAREQRGSPQAVQLILNAAGADGARISLLAERFDRFARSPAASRNAANAQNGAGTIRISPAMRDRLRVTPLSARPMSEIGDFGGRGFWDSLAGRSASSPRVRNRREDDEYVSVTDHMLTLGAIVAAGATRTERRRVSALLDEPLMQHCLHMQRLQLRQCVGVSVNASERAYCLGQHALAGPGQCFSAVVR
ncbi:MAG: hypothetical protein AB7H66_13630 [Hyphomonadaceae bacterium]